MYKYIHVVGIVIGSQRGEIARDERFEVSEIVICDGAQLWS